MDKKETTLLFGTIEKEQKLKVEGTLLGKIGTVMDEKGTKTLCKEHYWIRRKIYGQKGNNSFVRNYWKEQKLKVEGTLLGKIGTFMVVKGTKTLNEDWKGTKSLKLLLSCLV